MEPLSFSDDQLDAVLNVARVVPVRLRNRYLRGIAKRLSGVRWVEKHPESMNDFHLERAVRFALAKLDATERSKVSPEKN